MNVVIAIFLFLLLFSLPILGVYFLFKKKKESIPTNHKEVINKFDFFYFPTWLLFLCAISNPFFIIYWWMRAFYINGNGGKFSKFCSAAVFSLFSRITAYSYFYKLKEYLSFKGIVKDYSPTALWSLYIVAAIINVIVSRYYGETLAGYYYILLSAIAAYPLAKTQSLMNELIVLENKPKKTHVMDITAAIVITVIYYSIYFYILFNRAG